jgi:hypothetical protein
MLRLRHPRALFALLVPVAALYACNDDAGRPPPDNVINIRVDGGTLGCAQPSFPSDQPDLSVVRPPIFLLTNSRSQQSSTGQAQVRPGEAMEAEIWVNGATQQVKVELSNAWSRGEVIYTTEEQTAGNETVSVVLFSDETIRGRYYLKLTLCEFDCDERQVVFDTKLCSDESDDLCGINAPYERTLIEDGEVVQVDDTCIDLGSTPGVGSGTVLIQ